MIGALKLTSGLCHVKQSFTQNSRPLYHVHSHVLTLDPSTVIPGEHHLTRDEAIVPLTGLGEHHSALLLSDCCSLLLWHCGAVHCQCGSPPGCLCSRGERHSSGYHSYICARTVPSSSIASVSNIIIHVHVTDNNVLL